VLKAFKGVGKLSTNDQVNSYIAAKELPLKVDKIDIKEALQARG